VTTAQTAPAKTPRLAWVDLVKALSILWIVFFHLYTTYYHGSFPSTLDLKYFPKVISQYRESGIFNAVSYFGEAVFNWVVQLGFHAVGVFIILSGFGLTYSLAKIGDPKGGWGRWYWRRLVRIFPMYWVAHILYLVSPFVARPEPVDYRFILSFLGDRIYPLDMIFFYMNPALWYFGLLLQLYLVFPFLFRLLQRLGPGKFLAVCAFATFLCRYLMLCVFRVNGDWVQGAFFGARLWEFAAGMVLAWFYRLKPGLVEERLFSWQTLVFGLIIYGLGLLSYASLPSYTFTDALTGTGIFIFLALIARWYTRIKLVGPTLAFVGAHSYGIYLLHQPYIIYFGERMRQLSLPVFLVAACLLIAVVCVCAIPLERYVNKLTALVLDGRKVASPVVAPSVPGGLRTDEVKAQARESKLHRLK
jgi:peptidoglycan/LPS O-acetylase OafA/YrhL